MQSENSYSIYYNIGNSKRAKNPLAKTVVITIRHRQNLLLVSKWSLFRYNIYLNSKPAVTFA